MRCGLGAGFSAGPSARFSAGCSAAAAVLACLLATAAAAQPAPPARAASAAAPPAVGARPVTTELRVFEDDQVRIEETRIRGQLQRVTVSPKASTMRPYEINVGTGGRDPSQDKGSAGQRVWSVLRF